MITSIQTAPSTIYPVNDVSTNQDDNEPSMTIAIEQSTVNTNKNVNTEIDYLKSRLITTVKQRPRKKYIPPPTVTGNLLSDSNVITLREQEEKRKSKNVEKPTKSKEKSLEMREQSSKNSRPPKSKPKPCTSGVQSKHIIDQQEEAPLDESQNSTDTEEDMCCVCHKRFPAALSGCTSLVIVKWGQCDQCGHWVHLRYCTSVSVLRRDSEFVHSLSTTAG